MTSRPASCEPRSGYESRLAELEAACIADWDRGQLAVYADALQAANDPRGELIAIDLHAEANRATTALDERRKQLLVEWLGAEVAAAVRCVWGFLELRHDTPEGPDLLAKLLGSPGGAYLRGLELWGEASFIESTLFLLSLAPRPRLAGLALNQSPGRGSHTVAGKFAANLIRATPALDTLVLRGSKIFGAFPHPTLRRVRVAGWDALGSLAGIGGPLPALEELDFATNVEFVLNAYGIANAELDRLLRGVPALRRLDLSRNEPSDQPWARRIDLFKFLRELSLKRKLTHLRVPSLRTPADVVNLQASIDRMPDLVELEVTRVFEAPPGTPQPRLALFHPAKIVLPRDSPWGPRTHSRGRDAIAIQIPGHPYPLVAELLDAVKLMESSYIVRSGRERDTLPTSSRTAWHHIWNALDRLGWDGANNRPASIAIDAGLFVDALALPDDLLELRWRGVRDALRARRSERGEALTIRRSWTY